MRNNVKDYMYSIPLFMKKKMCIYLHMNVCVKHIYLFAVDILCLRKGKLRNWSEWLCSERVPDG